MAERLASFISGGGTTMEQIIMACKSGKIPMEFGCVIVSTPDAGGLQKASKLGIPAKDLIVINPDDFRGEDDNVDMYAYGIKTLRELQSRGITVITQNGLLAKTSPVVIDAYKDTIFNQHPGPKKETRATKGTQPHAIMLYIAQHTGRNNGTEVITHRVNEKWDDGPTVGFTPVPIHDIFEDPKTLQTRALPVEHELQITLLQQVASGTVREVPDNRVYIQPGEEHVLHDARRDARRRYPDG